MEATEQDAVLSLGEELRHIEADTRLKLEGASGDDALGIVTHFSEVCHAALAARLAEQGCTPEQYRRLLRSFEYWAMAEARRVYRLAGDGSLPESWNQTSAQRLGVQSMLW